MSRYGHATNDCRVQLGAPNSDGVQQVQQNNNKTPEQLVEFLLLVELELHSLIALL